MSPARIIDARPPGEDPVASDRGSERSKGALVVLARRTIPAKKIIPRRTRAFLMPGEPERPRASGTMRVM
eukprot:30677-Pelagococcus_subviridis.AAC.2